MSRTKQLDKLYLQFLDKAQTAPDAVALDATEQKLLNLVAQAHAQSDIVNVTELLTRDDIASPATLHKRLTSLREKRLITIEPIPNEYPRKTIDLTNKAISYFNALSKSMRQAVAKNR